MLDTRPNKTVGRRAIVSRSGNGTACIVVSWWEGELNREKLNRAMWREIDPPDVEAAVTTDRASCAA